MTITFAPTDTLHLTNLTKVFWPEHGYAKRDLIDYYREAAMNMGCSNPLFSPNGRTLAVTGANFSGLQLWDLPIREPIGRILGLGGLAAVATLLAFNGLGWLRRRRSIQTAVTPVSQ